MDVNFEERKYTFDDIAEEYEKIRPTYPKELFQDLFMYANIEKEERILEIGCGTGKATEGLVELGYKQIDCIELGERLAKFTAAKFQNENSLNVYQGNFENWDQQDDSYSLAVSATAFHFINPEIGYQKVANLLHKHGTMAFFWTYHIQPDADVFREIGACYEKYAPQLHPNQFPTPEELIEERKNLTMQHDLFQDLVVKTYKWTDTYTSDDYIALIHTQSAHRLLPQEVKEKLFRSIHNVIEKHGGKIEKPQFVALYLARKK
ncbi:methyltransferase domain-containing protein [Bacillus cytotoxicus]|uniref:Methyltransferase domain-containing protein n=1 Tax=Bacillus cytotoxicus TaxID=580165 RepID=A0ACC6ABZ5_9BACI|nr:methyltransferase domain-containing protein [Bacillus cytotoxicus]